VSGDTGSKVRVWEVETGRQLRRLDGHTAAIRYAAFTPDGRRILTCSGDSHDGRAALSGMFDVSIRLWDVETGKEMARLVGPTLGVRTLAMSADGRMLAGGTDSGEVWLWEIASGKKVHNLRGAVHVAFTPDGSSLVGAGGNNQLSVWNVVTGEVTHKLQRGTERLPLSLAMSPGGKRLVTADVDQSIRLWALP
jgi:WD40 repeat protein